MQYNIILNCIAIQLIQRQPYYSICTVFVLYTCVLATRCSVYVYSYVESDASLAKWLLGKPE